MFRIGRHVFSRSFSQFCGMTTEKTKLQATRIFWEAIFKKPFIPVKEANTFDFCQNYSFLTASDKCSILRLIATNYGINHNLARNSAQSYLLAQEKDPENLLKSAEKLKSAFSPRYIEAFHTISKMNQGIKFLVDLRADVINLLQEMDSKDEDFIFLKDLNNQLKEMLSFCFNVGFLTLERITWTSSCQILQKISEYEVVHPMRNWTDLKKRVGPYRRCFVFTHSSMPYEPIVMLHTALTDDISSNIHSIVNHPKEQEHLKPTDETFEDQSKINALIFYSITSTQKGLKGIELGNQLIKQVVGEVLKEFPHITKFSSLSPIPGFRDWILMEIRKANDGESILPKIFSEINFPSSSSSVSQKWMLISQLIASNRWTTDSVLGEILKKPLLRLCAHYLYKEKRRLNALNSVAHFHLHNGAELWRLNWEADLSPRGLDNSCGIMVNYRYFMDETEANSQKYIQDHFIKISDYVKELI